MTSKILVALLLTPALLLGLLATADYAVVDVRDGGTRIVVPVPVFAVSFPMRFAPPEARYVEVPEIVRRYLPLARRAVEVLQDARDAVLVTVEDGRESVRIEKVDDEIEIEVIDEDEEVRVQIPLHTVTSVLDGYDDRGFDTHSLLGVIGDIDHGDLVHVREGDAEFRVWIW